MQQVVSAMVGMFGEGLVAVFGVELLFDRCEEAVEVDVEVGEVVGLGSGGHRGGEYGEIIFALCLLFVGASAW